MSHKTEKKTEKLALDMFLELFSKSKINEMRKKYDREFFENYERLESETYKKNNKDF